MQRTGLIRYWGVSNFWRYILCRRRYPSKAYTGVGNTWDVDRIKRRQHGSNDDHYRDVAPAVGDAA
jgi:hypothetical protein